MYQYFTKFLQINKHCTTKYTHFVANTVLKMEGDIVSFTIKCLVKIYVYSTHRFKHYYKVRRSTIRGNILDQGIFG